MDSNGDCSRKRRLIGNQSRIDWYARHRCFRFACSDFAPHHGNRPCTCGSFAMEPNYIAEAVNLLEMEKSFDTPFPMGVFGTLRKNQGNHQLMHRGKFHASCRAFMPNFIAKGLTLIHSKGSSAPFEIYFYNLSEWNLMIPRVDMLEGFSPKNVEKYSFGGYYRTLAYLHVIPDDNKDVNFNDGIWGERDLKIPQENWDKFTKVPCWVYSNKRNNMLCNGYPIIWG